MEERVFTAGSTLGFQACPRYWPFSIVVYFIIYTIIYIEVILFVYLHLDDFVGKSPFATGLFMPSLVFTIRGVLGGMSRYIF